LVGERPPAVYDAYAGNASIGVDLPGEFRNNVWFYSDSLSDHHGGKAWMPHKNQVQPTQALNRHAELHGANGWQ
jgi:hypothetical protein